MKAIVENTNLDIHYFIWHFELISPTIGSEQYFIMLCM